MDFFATQDQRQARTRGLLGLVALATFLYLGLIYGILLIFYRLTLLGSPRTFVWTWWHPFLAAWTFGAGVTILGVAIVRKFRHLQKGGKILVEELGGRQVSGHTPDPHERQLRHVVEEMAIASGLPIPDTYVLPQEVGINAFAAGFSPRDAALAVSQGALRHLSRDELQALVAHEFSHILSGDMHLNLTLLGWLHGIQTLGATGLFLLRAASGGKLPKWDLRVLLLGPLLTLLGSFGVFSGRLIKRAIARQREYFADAAAVQFTRNPSALSGVLKKIGGYRWGSRINHPNVEETSHMYFSSAFRSPHGSWLSTHPPLAERIRKIEPHFQGIYPEIAKNEALPGLPTKLSVHFSQLDSSEDGLAKITPDHVVFASVFLRELPDEIYRATLDTEQAQALVIASVLSTDPNVKAKQVQEVQISHGELFRKTFPRADDQLRSVPEQGRLPLLSLAMPALQNLAPKELGHLFDLLKRLISADKEISFFEFILGRTLKDQLLRRPSAYATQYTVLRPLLNDCAKLFSVLVHQGKPKNTSMAQEVFRRGVQHLTRTSLVLQPPEAISYADLNRTLDRLAKASPLLKKRILQCCAMIIFADQEVTVAEGELLRITAQALHIALPPLLKSHASTPQSP